MRYKITKSVKRSPAAPLWHCCRYIVVVCVQIYIVVVFSILRSYKKYVVCSCAECVRQRWWAEIKAAGVCSRLGSNGSIEFSEFIKFQFLFLIDMCVYMLRKRSCMADISQHELLPAVKRVNDNAAMPFDSAIIF